jgi:hypothetical protein
MSIYDLDFFHRLHPAGKLRSGARADQTVKDMGKGRDAQNRHEQVYQRQ